MYNVAYIVHNLIKLCYVCTTIGRSAQLVLLLARYVHTAKRIESMTSVYRPHWHRIRRRQIVAAATKCRRRICAVCRESTKSMATILRRFVAVDFDASGRSKRSTVCILTTNDQRTPDDRRPTTDLTSTLENFKWSYLCNGSSDPPHVCMYGMNTSPSYTSYVSCTSVLTIFGDWRFISVASRLTV